MALTQVADFYPEAWMGCREQGGAFVERMVEGWMDDEAPRSKDGFLGPWMVQAACWPLAPWPHLDIVLGEPEVRARPRGTDQAWGGESGLPGLLQ